MNLTRWSISVYIRLCYHAGVAQLAEQLICNQQVGGSNPSTSSRTLTLAIRGRFLFGRRAH